jgi:hydroxylamine reductase
MSATYSADMLVGEIVKSDVANIEILENAGMGCVGCPASQSESLADACMVHGLDTDEVLSMLNGRN